MCKSSSSCRESSLNWLCFDEKGFSMAPRFVEQPVQVLQHSNPHRPLPFGFSAGA